MCGCVRLQSLKTKEKKKTIKIFCIFSRIFTQVELSLRSINICIYMCSVVVFFMQRSMMAIKVFHTRLKRNMRARRDPLSRNIINRKWKHFQVICNPKQNLQLWVDLSIMKMKTEAAQLETTGRFDWIARVRKKEREWGKNWRKQRSHNETKAQTAREVQLPPKMRHSASSWDKDTKKDTVDDTNVRNSDTYVGCVNQSLQIRILASIFMLVGLVIGWTNRSSKRFRRNGLVLPGEYEKSRPLMQRAYTRICQIQMGPTKLD